MTAFNPADFTSFNPVAVAEPTFDREALACAVALREAAVRWELRRDAFAAGKAGTCRDIATKLEEFGSFASDRQREYAVNLVEWSKPRQPRMTLQSDEQRADDACTQPAARAEVNTLLPKLFDLMQRLSKLTIGELTIARKNQDSLCWVKHARADKVVGKIEGGVLTTWQRPGIDQQALHDELLRIEADPEAAAALHGKLSGRCSICSRDLTDPESIERGIGPICAGKF